MEVQSWQLLVHLFTCCEWIHRLNLGQVFWGEGYTNLSSRRRVHGQCDSPSNIDSSSVCTRASLHRSPVLFIHLFYFVFFIILHFIKAQGFCNLSKLLLEAQRCYGNFMESAPNFDISIAEINKKKSAFWRSRAMTINSHGFLWGVFLFWSTGLYNR